MFWLLNSEFVFSIVIFFDLFHVQGGLLVKKRNLHLGPNFLGVAWAVDCCWFFFLLFCIWFSFFFFSA